MSTEKIDIPANEGTTQKNGAAKKAAGNAAKFGAAAAAGVAGTMGYEAWAADRDEVEEVTEEVSEETAQGQTETSANEGAHENAENEIVDPDSVRLDDDDVVDESTLDEIDENELHPVTGEAVGDDDEVAFIDIDDVEEGEFSEPDFDDIEQHTDMNVEYDANPIEDTMADTDVDMGGHDVLDDMIDA